MLSLFRLCPLLLSRRFLVALALFGAFATETGLSEVNILKPLEFAGLVFGAMLPYYFTAQTMGAVGDAA